MEARVSDLIESIRGGVSVNGEDRPMACGEAGVLKLSAVTGGRFDPTQYKTIQLEERALARESPGAGCIVISRSNTAELVGASAYVPENYPDLFLPDTIWQLKPAATEEVCMRWLSFVLASPNFRRQLSRLAKGTSGSMKKISMADLAGIRVKVPPIGEQREIARVLAFWDRSTDLTERLIATKQQRRKWLIQQLLTGKRRFLGFSDQWPTVHLKEIIKPVSRRVPKPPGPYTALGIRSHCKGTFSRVVAKPDTVAMEELYVACADDLIVSITFAWEGAIAIVPTGHDGYLVSHRFPTFRAKPDRIHLDYLRYLVTQQRFIFLLGLISPGGAGRNRVLSKLDFLELRVPLPGVAEQEKIARVLRFADSELSHLTEILEALREQKKGLMQLLLTGKVRVTGSSQ